jgi:hypothetical protein
LAILPMHPLLTINCGWRRWRGEDTTIILWARGRHRQLDLPNIRTMSNELLVDKEPNETRSKQQSAKWEGGSIIINDNKLSMKYKKSQTTKLLFWTIDGSIDWFDTNATIKQRNNIIMH